MYVTKKFKFPVPPGITDNSTAGNDMQVIQKIWGKMDIYQLNWILNKIWGQELPQ